MSKNLILVSGLYGSGKTMYCTTVKYPVIHIDHCFNYTTEVMDYNRIKKWKNENNQYDTLVLDAYLFDIDIDLSKLKETISPIKNIGIKTIYTTIEELYKCQRSTPERRANKKKQNLSKEEDMKLVKQGQKQLINIFTGFLEKDIISFVEYIFREGSQYKITNKEHFLKTLGE